MRQRLGIAAALLRSPRLLILDEPTTGLDPAGMRDMRELVRDLAARGITVLLSSHLLSEVDELCNRVAIVRKGSIAYEGSLAELQADCRAQLPGPHERRRARAGDPVPAAEVRAIEADTSARRSPSRPQRNGASATSRSASPRRASGSSS